MERPQYPDDGTFGKFLRIFRHPLRATAMALAAVALSWGILMPAGVTAAVIGAILGVVTGELVGRSRIRLAPAAVGAALLVLMSWGAASLATGGEWIPSVIGPGGALKLAGMLRYGSLAFGLTALLRSAAARHPAAMGLELGAVVMAVAVLFSSHRDGVIARPLWISDWAWQKGIDPGDVFLGVGAAAAVILAVLLVLERRSGRTASSLLALPLLALLAVACLEVVGPPAPQAEDGLGLTDDQTGDPPNTPPPREDERDDQPGGGDGGARPERRDGGGGGTGDDGGSQAGQQDGGAGGGAADGGASGGGADAGTDGGAAGGGADGGSTGGGADAGADGGGGGGEDAGSDGGAGGGGTDAGVPPPPPPTDGQGQGGEQPPSTPRESQLTDQSDQGPSQSPAPMAVVVLDNDYSPPSQGYYFRQEAWSELDGARLVPATVDGADGDTLADFPTRSTAVRATPPGERTRVTATVAMLIDHQHPFALESPVRFEPATNPNPERFVRAYRFESLAQETDYGELLGRQAGSPDWTDEVRALYLEAHADPRFAELAQQILDDNLPPTMHDDPFARALSIKLWLDRELIYSTAERHANVEDPTVDFLFGNRTGYCVHFAHTAVFLWRALGLPARIGTGYMVPEENRRGGSAILVRSGDAHAWPELYLDGVGWVVLDIAAERNLDEPGQPLDEDLQRMLGEMARDQPADPADEIEEDPAEGSGLSVNPWLALGVLLGAVLTVLYGIKLWRRLAPLFAGQRSVARVRYRALLDRLAEVGLAREYGETREQFARRVGTLAPAFEQATSLHVAARLRDPGTAAAQRPEWSGTVWREVSRDFGRQVSGGTRWWRRLVGFLHPVSFLDSR